MIRHMRAHMRPLVVFVWLIAAISVLADERLRDTIATSADLREALSSVVPGSVLTLENGVYQLDEDLRITARGTAERPVIIKSRDLLQARFVGDGRIRLVDCEHVELRGFTFAMRAERGGKEGAVSLESSQRCRVSQNRFELEERASDVGNRTWLTVHGERSRENRIDHNRFTNKVAEGHFIFISGDGMDMSQRDVIDRNLFVNRAYGGGSNGWETIRVGESPVGNADGGTFTTVRDNRFENCSGEDEMISFKVGDCVFASNTVVNCHGSVVLRTGNRSVVENNVFIRTHASPPFDGFRAGGVRVYGSDHRVVGNHFLNLDGYGFLAPLNVMPGAEAGSDACGVADCLPATRCEFRGNTWVRCRELRLGYDSDPRPLPPTDCVFAENKLYGGVANRPPVLMHEADGIDFRDNTVWLSNGVRGWKAPAGFTVIAGDVPLPDMPDILEPSEVGPFSD